MIAAGSAYSFANNLVTSWFDIVVVIVLAFGLFRGRRNGLSRELLPLLQWIAIVTGCGMGYPTVAQPLIQNLKWGRAVSNVCGYVALAVVMLIFFGILKRLLTERLVKNDAFKDGEYYLGMPAGMLRFACMLVAALALINAPVYTDQDIINQKIRARANFGGGSMSGNFFPHFNEVQDAIFKQSVTGRFIKTNLRLLLIDEFRLEVKHKVPPRTAS